MQIRMRFEDFDRIVIAVQGNRCYTPNLGKIQIKARPRRQRKAPPLLSAPHAPCAPCPLARS